MYPYLRLANPNNIPPIHGYSTSNSTTAPGYHVPSPLVPSASQTSTRPFEISGPHTSRLYDETRPQAPFPATSWDYSHFPVQMMGKRQRGSQSCNSCRSRKQKCDEGRPCQSCREKNVVCEYKYKPPSR
jgi:hypothetical protein